VPTSLFLDLKYSGVSAIIACSMDRLEEANLPVDVVHNHFAHVRVPERILGSAGEEWVTNPVGTDGAEIELRRLEPSDAKVEN